MTRARDVANIDVILTTKGDIYAASSAYSPVRQGAGTNEHRLIADSATATGLNYVADTINYAVNAKGDLLAGTAADTVAPVTIGADGTVLLADSAQATGMTWSAGIPVQVNAQVATYTAILSDAFKLITMNNSAANDFNIPTNSVAYPVGTVLNVISIGTGQTTIKALTPGTTTVLSTGATAASPKLRVRYSSATCIKIATETWYIIGDLT